MCIYQKEDVRLQRYDIIKFSRRFYNYHWVDTSAEGLLLVPE